DLLKSADAQFLSDYRNLLCQGILYSLGAVLIPCLCHECIHILCFCSHCLVGNSLYKSLELCILCNKVCLRVYLYDCCGLIILILCHNKTLCRNSSGFLHSLSFTVLSQVFDRCIHISVCLVQSLLAVHHSCAGQFS